MIDVEGLHAAKLVARLRSAPMLRTWALREALGTDKNVRRGLERLARRYGCVVVRYNRGQRYKVAFGFRRPRGDEVAGELVGADG